MAIIVVLIRGEACAGQELYRAPTQIAIKGYGGQREGILKT
uniref:Uncharacterized protein n=1 Tax=Rhizophora mucronata TaxID=61149 RepID=A0A2P2PV58_RHIMU